MNVRHFGLLRNKRGISPAFSTMILTAGVIVMILVAMTYASNMLNSGLAENEFSTNEQFMQTAGLEIDDIAWTIGRTQTVSYQSSSGQVTFEPDALTYNVEVHQGGIWEVLPLTVQTGIILYNMPLSSYKMVNGYFHVLTSNENNTF